MGRVRAVKIIISSTQSLFTSPLTKNLCLEGTPLGRT